LEALLDAMPSVALDRDSVQLKEHGFYHFFAGLMCGFSILLLQPLELCKTRQQITTVVGRTGILSTLRHVARVEGFLSIYKGVLPNMVSYSIMSSLQWGLYGNFKEVIMRTYSPPSSETGKSFYDLLVVRSLAGLCVGTTLPIIKCPLDVIKCTQQAHFGKGGSIRSVGQYLLTSSPSLSVGVRRMYRGFSISIPREMIGLCFWFNYMEILWQHTNQLKDGGHMRNYIGLNLVGGIGGALTYWAPVFPLDCVKTRLQNARQDTPSTFMKECRWLFNDGGIRAFYRGLRAMLLYSSLSGGVAFMIYCSSLEWSGRHRDD